jgi:hypothetical protein
MSIKLTTLLTAYYIPLVRSSVVILGCIAVWWGIVAFPIFRQESSTKYIADRIIAGDPFKVEILAQQLPLMKSIETSVYCNATAIRSTAIIRLRMLEAAASANERELFDERLKSFGKVIRSSLSCVPTDSFLWLALNWAGTTENGSNPNNLKSLWMSYRLGPNEGWIALKRNRLAFARFQQLPPDLVEIAITEFIALIENNFYEQAADILIGPAWPERELILSRLARVSDRDRKLFADALDRRGYDVNAPGIARPGLPLRR